MEGDKGIGRWGCGEMRRMGEGVGGGERIRSG